MRTILTLKVIELHINYVIKVLIMIATVKLVNTVGKLLKKQILRQIFLSNFFPIAGLSSALYFQYHLYGRHIGALYGFQSSHQKTGEH